MRIKWNKLHGNGMEQQVFKLSNGDDTEVIMISGSGTRRGSAEDIAEMLICSTMIFRGRGRAKQMCSRSGANKGQGQAAVKTG